MIPNTLVNLPHEVSRIIVLEDIVEPEEVDEDLREEVKMECEKFGTVLNCIIH